MIRARAYCGQWKEAGPRAAAEVASAPAWDQRTTPSPQFRPKRRSQAPSCSCDLVRLLDLQRPLPWQVTNLLPTVSTPPGVPHALLHIHSRYHQTGIFPFSFESSSQHCNFLVVPVNTRHCQVFRSS
jgi:hypothetical protein